MNNKTQRFLITLLVIIASGATLSAQKYQKGLIDKTIALIGNI